MRHVKYIILGAGSSGLTALGRIRHETDDFVMINGGAFGTTCARVGCMPSKALIHCAEHFHARKHFYDFGIDGADGLSVDLAAVMKRVRAFRDRFTSGVQAGSTDTLKEGQLIKGYAKFVSPDTVEVNGEQIQGERIIIATGSRPVVPEPWKALGNKLMTSDDLFELETLPKRIAVIGLGIIGLEIGQALSRLGVEVIGFEMSDTIGGLNSPKASRQAIKLISKEFPIYLGEPAQVEASGDSVKVTVSSGCFEVDAVFASLGRRPNIDTIGLEKLGVELDEKGMPSFNINTMQISDLPVFIAGDVNAFRPILHEAGHEGKIAVNNAMAYPDVTAYRRKTPLGIAFIDPQIGFFGTSYPELDLDETVVVDFKLERNNGRAIVMGEDKGVISLYADKASKQLIGGELIMPHAEHFTHLLTWAVEQKLEVLELLRMPYYHPVLEEAIESAIRLLADALYSTEEIDALEILPSK
ncbi:dihydrolipoyl dehydrogenase [Hydrogenovibrio sp. 3SP14C1]|uniref:dihydrolipoyl dehydrogenase n=1 Tax=Hydrogenovibrio sp. 3SP14C1 TaxID=3038774 RepID=UPI0024165C47|nr:dihydrolipoyl dehydrogenase [Hydrogenovibrio sp. 3SP14C1]MDG4812908.1 dihydrolipoyl dehydrogenase [Hydrogenovibrio sp. 3SP14C1]